MPNCGSSRENQNGGDVCESNTPKTLCTPRNGFEGREVHQEPTRLRMGVIVGELLRTVCHHIAVKRGHFCPHFGVRRLTAGRFAAF